MRRLVLAAAALLLAAAPARAALLAPAAVAAPAVTPPLRAAPAPAWPPPLPWGAKGHAMAARTAVSGLPAELPAFFRDADDGLAYLNPEPDRWRSQALVAMQEAWTYDHYIDLENIPDGALDAPDRFTYLRALYEAGLEVPERDGGFLPYRILELYQRLVTEWRLWREADPADRRWIEMRIVNDAGVLGHYVTDASQPHHTTIHYNGWNAEAPNPRGFSYADDFHWRFESLFVDAHVEQADVDRYATPGTRDVSGQARTAIWAYILDAHAQVERLYELEQALGFREEEEASEDARSFAARRLAAGADMLRTLWWSAWVESAEPVDEG